MKTYLYNFLTKSLVAGKPSSVESRKGVGCGGSMGGGASAAELFFRVGAFTLLAELSLRMGGGGWGGGGCWS